MSSRTSFLKLRLSPVLPVLLAMVLLSVVVPGAQGAESVSTGNRQATSDSVVEARGRAIEEERTALEQAREDLDKRKEEIARLAGQLETTRVTEDMLSTARLARDSARIQLEAVQLDRMAAQREQQALEDQIKQLEERVKALLAGAEGPADPKRREAATTEAKGQLGTAKAMLALEKRQAEILGKRQELLQEELETATSWERQLLDKYRRQQEATRREALEDLALRLTREQEEWLRKATELREKLRQVTEAGAATEAERHLLETRIKEAEESAYLLQVELKDKRALHTLESYPETLADPATSTEVLAEAQKNLENLVKDFQSTRGITAKKLAVLRQQEQVIGKRRALGGEGAESVRQEQTILSRLIGRFEQQLAQLDRDLEASRQRLERIKQAYKLNVRRGLSARHTLPGTLAEWGPLAAEFNALPETVGEVVAETVRGLGAGLTQATANQWLLLILAEALWLGFCIVAGRFARRYFLRITSVAADACFSARARIIVGTVYYKNRFSILFFGAVIWVAWITEITAPGLTVILVIAGLWLGVAVSMRLAGLLLSSSLTPPQWRQPGLYRLVAIVTLLAGFSAAVLALGNLGGISDPLSELMSRAFTLVLLALAYASLRLRPLLMETAELRLVKRHWVQLVRLVTFAVPFSFFAAGALGLAGYINLARAVALYLASFLLVTFLWLGARALLRDGVNKLKDYTNAHSNKGLMWAQGIIEPLHRVARIALFFGALGALFALHGWGPDSEVVQSLKGWFTVPLVTIGKASINLQHIIGTMLIIILVFWLGRWVRHITYNWLYGQVADLGVRNSLSVFTQYVFVLVGLFVALNTLGLDLTSLALFAGALGVGIGFGLQNITNNFISGLILLAERPIRAGDWVTVGTNEGEVSRIGIRSVTVTTWDNQDVIIPNADIVSTAFTNWTHQDNIVRTVLNVGVSYDDDPHNAARIIFDAIKNHPAVLEAPHAHVWMSQFGESSVDFWVQYYIDVRKNRRLQVKSEILFAIWDALREGGITIPFPQRDLHIKDWPGPAPNLPAP